jgi:hypothetical protein
MHRKKYMTAEVRFARKKQNYKSRYGSMVSLILMFIFALALCQPASAQEQTPAADVQEQTTTPPPPPQISPPPPPPAGDYENEWHFSVTPYLWFAGSHGSIGALNHDISFHASPSDLLSHADIGLMGGAEASYKHFVLSGDILWIRLSDDKAFPFPGLGTTTFANVHATQFLWTSKIGYRLVNREKFKIDATTGIRYWHLGSKLGFNPSTLGLNFNGSQNWVDPLVGGQIQTALGRKVELTVLGDVGGWGVGSQLDYQIVGLLGFKIGRAVTLQLGYRYLDVDYRNNGFLYDAATSGALIGFTFHLK